MRVYESNQVTEIVYELKNGKVAIIPTDTFYAVISLSEQRIYSLKQRSISKKLINFINCDEMENIEFSQHQKQMLKKYWPGPLTVILNGKSYRVPKSNLIEQIVDYVGPIFSSSANISGLSPITTIDEVKKQFNKNIHDIIFVKDNISQSNIASTVFDLNSLKVLRVGEIGINQLIKDFNI